MTNPLPARGPSARRPTFRRLAVAALVVAGCAAQQKYDPYRAPRDTVQASLKLVAIAPVRVPDDLEDAEPVKARFDALLAERLGAAGIAVVPAAEVAPVVEAKTKEAGPLFDPETGKIDQERAKARRAAIGQALKERFGADVWIEPQVRVVRAPVGQDVARWDGVSEPVYAGLLQTILVKHSGSVPALSFYVWLSNVEGEYLYVNAGGLQVLDRIALGGRYVKRPRAELFADEERNAAAVALAVEPLVEQRRR
jgi:hypothetical protein